MSYTLQNAIDKTRVFLNDTSENVWKDIHIKAFVNEAIKIIRGTIPEFFTSLETVSATTDIIVIDEDYEELLPMFASSRCFDQDEQFYRATSKMNEFETRKQDMEEEIRQSNEYTALSDYTDNDNVVDEYFDDGTTEVT